MELYDVGEDLRSRSEVLGMVILACSSRMHSEKARQGRAIAGDVEPESFSVRSVAFQYVWPHLLVKNVRSLKGLLTKIDGTAHHLHIALSPPVL